MTGWLKAVRWDPGTERPRGIVQVMYSGVGHWDDGLEESEAWGQVVRYRLPDTEEGRREAARIRKANSRAKCARLDMPLPIGTAEALARVAKAAGFDDRRECVAWIVPALDGLLSSDRHMFDAVTAVTTKAGDLTKYYSQLGVSIDEDRDK